MLELPHNWVSTPIGDLITLNPKNNETPDDVTAGFVPMQMVGTSLRDKVHFEPRPWHEIKKGYTHFQNGDVLLAKITPCFENGKAGLVDGLPNGIGAGSTEYFVCRVNQKLVHAHYLLAFFKNPQFVRTGASQMTGSVGHKRVPKDYLTEAELPLAPLNEQKRIADKLDALLMQVDACRNRLDKIPGIIKRLRQAVLGAAFSGKLSEDWRNKNTDRTTSSCIENVQVIKKLWFSENTHHNEAHRVKKRCDQFTPIKAIDQLPVNWCWSKMEDSVLLIVDCHNKTAPYQNSGIPIIRTSNVRNGQIVWDELQFVNEETYLYWSKRCPPMPGDIIFTREAPMGEAAIIPGGMKLCLGQRTMLIRPIENCVSAKFILFSMLSENFKQMAAKFAVGTGVKHYRVGDVSEFLIPIPPTGEQAEIVRRVETLFAFADRLEARYTAARAQVENLTPALLAKAFRGELVPQDPNDEPASALLARIQAQRAAPAAKAKKPRASKT